MSFVSLTLEYFPDPTRGVPVFNGHIYVGEPNTDPTIAGNQKQVTLRPLSGPDVPAAQPIRTGAGGVALYDGSPVQLLVSGDYSLAVQNEQEALVYYLATASPTLDANSLLLADLIAFTGMADGNTLNTSGRISFDDQGGGLWVFNANDKTAEVAADPLQGVYVASGADITGASGAWVRSWEDSVDVAWFGADSNAIVASHDAINAASDFASSNGGRLTAKGTFLTTSKVTVKGDADLSLALFKVSGSPATALEVSTGSAVDPLDSFKGFIVKLPDIVNNDKPTMGWVGQGAGVRMVNVTSCEIWTGRITGFSIGVFVTAFNTGSAYNNFYIGHCENNQINLKIVPGNDAGWCNENNYFGGRFSFESSEGVDIAGTFNIYISKYSATSVGGPNNNVFYKSSIEGNTPEQHIIIVGSGFNTFVSARYEAANPKVAFKDLATDGAVSNVLFYGYAAQNINITEDPLSTRYNTVFDRGQIFITGKGLSIKNATSSASSAIDVYETSESVYSGVPSVELSAQALYGKRLTDTDTRAKLDFVYGRLYLGDGAEPPAVYLRSYGAVGWSMVGGYLKFDGVTSFMRVGMSDYLTGAGSPEGVVTAAAGSIYTNSSGGAGTTLYVKESGTGNTGWVAK